MTLQLNLGMSIELQNDGYSNQATSSEWILLIPAGNITGNDGRRFINNNPQVIINHNLNQHTSIPLDIEHATEIKGPKGEPAPAQGWFEELEIRNGQIWGKLLPNIDGRKLLKNKHYRYISPAFYHDSKGNILGISSIGLTNKPNFKLIALNQQKNLAATSKAHKKLTFNELNICRQFRLSTNEFLAAKNNI